MSTPTNKVSDHDKVLMMASASIVIPLYVWAWALLHHFIIEPYNLDKLWFVAPSFITLAASFIWAWGGVCELLEMVWPDTESDAAGESS